VVAVADGDTITVLVDTKTQYCIRLSGIDAPEKRQSFGTVFRQHLSGAVFQRRVAVAYHKANRYGRLIGKVMLDGQDECLAQVIAGLARHYKQCQREQSPEDGSALDLDIGSYNKLLEKAFFAVLSRSEVLPIQKAAEIDEMLLGSGAFLEGGVLPLGDERVWRHES
jgi:endonuclease YncB( thermonuclease family)